MYHHLGPLHLRGFSDTFSLVKQNALISMWFIICTLITTEELNIKLVYEGAMPGPKILTVKCNRKLLHTYVDIRFHYIKSSM